MRDGQPIAAVISMEGYRALRKVVRGIREAIEAGADPDGRVELVLEP